MCIFENRPDSSSILETAGQQAEPTVSLNEKRFRQLVEHIHEVFWISSPDSSTIFYVSPAYESIWGRTCESLYANPQSWLEAIAPTYREHLLTHIESQQGYDEEYPIHRPDGTIRWVRDRAFPVYDNSGTLHQLMGLTEDITDRKLAEEETELLQTVAQAIFASADFHSALEVALQKVCEATHWDFGEAWVPRPDRTVLECSPAWYSKTDRLATFRQQSESFTFPMGVGIPGRIWQSKNPEWCQDVSQAGQVYLRAQMALEAGLKAALGIPLIASDEVIAVLVFYMFEAREEDARLIELISASTELGLFIQRKQAEEEVRRSLYKERELSQLKSSFISMVSHEFRTPLTSIVLSAELLKKCEKQPLSEKQRRYFERIDNSAKRMTQLMEEVLLIGQSESGKLQFNPTLMDLKHFCQELVAELQVNVGDRYTLAFLHQGDFSQVYMDANLLQRILGNLLSNAIKYSPKGSFVYLELSRQNGAAIFRVKDSGIGIPPADQQHLFEFFYRATNVSTISGTGLGLAIVKQCIDLHGGQISVESAVGVGTTFTVKLPIGV